MQSGPISSTVCRKWHVPPEEAQKQLQCSQPAINHASVSLCVCVCCFGHRNVTHVNYRLISYWLKKTFLLQITSVESPRNYICPALQKNINLCIHRGVFSPIYYCKSGCKHKTNSCGCVCCFWCDPFLEVSDLFPVYGIPPGTTVSFRFSSRRIQCNLCFKEHSSVFHLTDISSEHHQGIKDLLQKVFPTREIPLPTGFKPIYWPLLIPHSSQWM